MRSPIFKNYPKWILNKSSWISLSNKESSRKERINLIFLFIMIFLDFVGKIAAFVKKLLPFSEYKNFYQIVTRIIQWHKFVRGLHFQAFKCGIGCSHEFIIRRILTHIFKNYHIKSILWSTFWFNWHWFCFETSVTHILLSFCAF